MGSKADLYKQFLTAEGFHPDVDGSLVIFKSEGKGYILNADDGDGEYFQLIFPNFWNIENDKERSRAYKAANDATMGTKVAKIYVREDGKNVWGSIEMFIEKPEQFKPVFTRSMAALMAGVNTFVTKMK